MHRKQIIEFFIGIPYMKKFNMTYGSPRNIDFETALFFKMEN